MLDQKFHAFISSKMAEMEIERKALFEFLPTLDYGVIKLNAWVFERDTPASEEPIRQVYLEALQNAVLYIGLFWNKYGEWTIDEFDNATKWGIDRHVYIKNVDTHLRDPRLQKFLDKHTEVTSGITIKWFSTLDELKDGIRLSIDEWIKHSLMRRRSLHETIVATSPNDIPGCSRKLIGRTNLFKKAYRLLENGDHVVLQGFPGVGKTALAAGLSVKWLSDKKGSVLWLKTGLGSIEKVETYWKMLAEREINLVVLDDLWHGHLLRTILDIIPTGLRILITSRRRYGIGSVIDVGNLKPNDALKMLSHYSGKNYRSASNANVLCKKLGYLPFAVEIAGITLKARRWRPEDLLIRIQKSPHNMNMPLDFAEAGRENVGKLLEISLNSIDSLSKQVFLYFGAFFVPKVTNELLELYQLRRKIQFGFEYEQWVEALSHKDDSMSPLDFWHFTQSYHAGKLMKELPASTHEFVDITQELTTLHDNGLIDWVGPSKDNAGYYQLHDLAYSYAQSLTTDINRQHALDACLMYVEPIESFGKTGRIAINVESDNLIGAAYWGLMNDRYFSSRILINELNRKQLLTSQGHYTQAISLLEKAIQKAQESNQETDEMNFLLGLGLIYLKFFGQFDTALNFVERALELAQQTENRLGEAVSISILGAIYGEKEDYLQSTKLFTKSISMLHEMGDEEREAMDKGNLGAMYIGVVPK